MAAYVGRFAPSPTGPLHFGSLVAALASYLDARAHGGTWLVRMEDVDETRCHAHFADDILATLTAFGFTWDGPVIVQSQRKARYAAALAKLHTRGLTYACTCSRREIADSAPPGMDGPVYPGTCRLARHGETGNAIRVITPDKDFHFTDRVQGTLSQNLAHDIGDFVLKRRDTLFAYQLAVVVDDADQAVSHIVRGADLLDSTPRQIYLAEALGFSRPSFLHIPVVTNEAGQKLSKQTLAAGISTRDACETLVATLTFLHQPITRHAAPADLLAAAVAAWDVEKIPRVRGCAAG